MNRTLLTAAATTALLLGAASASHASLMVSLDDGIGNSVSVVDQSGGDANAAVGAVSFIGNVGNFMINVTTGLSKPVLGLSSFPQMDLSSVNVTSQAGGTLTVELTDTDFSGSDLGTFVSQIGGAQGSGGTLSYATFMDCGNHQFGTTIQLSQQTFSSSPFAGSTSTSASLCGAYSLTEEVVLTLPGGFETTSFNANVALPEPGTLAIFGLGLVGIALVLRRKPKTA
jgi:hypothetical protein